ncbi:MAG: alpha/beta fold hydrolase [Acidimicrobiia bacterium]|nr:alpha/beta fold hydrolase [Acidimicrobiia bacterium]
MADLMDPLAAAFRLDGTNGEAVVLIHGYTGVPAHFRPLGHELNAAGFTVIAPRLAGHGTSMEDMATTRARDWLASARESIAAVADHDRVHLAGLSMGGLISLVLAKETGAASVTTINSPVIVRDKKLYATPVARWYIKKVEWPDEGLPDIDDEMVQYWLPYPGFYTSTTGGLLSLMRRALFAARRLDIPSLVIQSRVDETVDPRSAKVLHRLLGDESRLVWLEASLHNATLDRERDKISAAVLARVTDV